MNEEWKGSKRLLENKDRGLRSKAVILGLNEIWFLTRRWKIEEEMMLARRHKLLGSNQGRRLRIFTELDLWKTIRSVTDLKEVFSFWLSAMLRENSLL